MTSIWNKTKEAISTLFWDSLVFMFFSENPTKHNILKYTPLSDWFSYVLSASESSGEEWLSFVEKTSPGAFLKAVRVTAREKRIAREKRKERKNPAAKRRSGLLRKRTQAYRHKKALKRFCLRASVKTATTYSPTCAVPSAWRSLTSLFGMGRGGTFVQ